MGKVWKQGYKLSKEEQQRRKDEFQKAWDEALARGGVICTLRITSTVTRNDLIMNPRCWKRWNPCTGKGEEPEKQLDKTDEGNVALE